MREPVWISVDKRLPEEPYAVLTCVYNEKIGVSTWNIDYCHRNDDGTHWWANYEKNFGSNWKVTHWMELPTLPF